MILKRADRGARKASRRGGRDAQRPERTGGDDPVALAFAAAHALKQPVRAVAAYLQLVEDSPEGRELPPRLRAWLARAARNAGRMQRLIDGYLEFARAGGADGEPAADARRALREAIERLTPRLEAAGGTIEHGLLPRVRAGSQRLARVFELLLDNAISFRGSAPLVVRVAARREGGRWLICVADNGLGFEQRFAERIFLPFERLHSRAEAEGSGMGLAICRRLLEAAGGSIRAESSPGKGASFLFGLPAARARGAP